MKLQLTNNTYFDTSKGFDISLLLSPKGGALAWYCEPVKIWPVVGDGFIGKVSEGGSTNFNNIQLNPHGNGTHTENVGHISKAFHSINDSLKEFHFKANLITIEPKPYRNKDWDEDDLIIDTELLEKSLKNVSKNEALVIRTSPNDLSKQNKNYSHSNPPYITESAITFLNNFGIKHLLIDLPSVDRETDHGKLLAHKEFWNYPASPILDKTITELVYVDDEVLDGEYILQFQIISLENDASPSKPILYKIETI
jgi:kynurenine formamidase